MAAGGELEKQQGQGAVAMEGDGELLRIAPEKKEPPGRKNLVRESIALIPLCQDPDGSLTINR